MLFKNSSVLYALFALLIPIIIHLFKLRKFQKTAFTNVAFLEKIKLQSRKSSQLKKWLVLCSRLGIFAMIILTFAKPYFPASSKETKPEQYIIYLDNSFSMQAKGANGTLLQQAIQEIITEFDINETFSLFTNDEVFKNIQISDSQNEILDIEYTSEQLSPEQVLLKAKNLSKGITNSALIAISDFQKNEGFDYSVFKNLKSIIHLKPQQAFNTSIDSLWVNTKDNLQQLNISIFSSEINHKTSLSVHNKEKLIGRASIDFANNSKQTIQIPLPKDTSINGIVKLENSKGLSFDNTRYFSINKTQKTNVLVIGDAFFQFLKKIYTNDEFNFNVTNLQKINYAEIAKSNIIILNELDSFPNALEQNLSQFVKNGGTLCIIPSFKQPKAFQNFALKNFNIKIGEFREVPKKLTQISFQHPIFNNVFNKKVINFQYPTIKKSYILKSRNWIFNLEDRSPFLIQQGSVFIFSSPLNEEITNFKKSPLIVPCFYNMAKQNSSSSEIEYTIGEENTFNINSIQNQDEVLTLKSDIEQFIPLQHIFQNYVKISTSDLPKKAGNYNIVSKDQVLHTVSFNYNSKESDLTYSEIDPGIFREYTNSVTNYFQKSKASFETTDLWKWFLIFALFFVIVEILLLKFLK